MMAKKYITYLFKKLRKVLGMTPFSMSTPRAYAGMTSIMHVAILAPSTLRMSAD